VFPDGIDQIHISRLIKPDSPYFPINLNMTQVNIALPFDLHVKVHGQMVLFKDENSHFSESAMSNLRSRNLCRLFIRNSDLNKFPLCVEDTSLSSFLKSHLLLMEKPNLARVSHNF
jgi:hypothetical protein